jgi:alanyl-tRNA synthetase
MGDFSTELCGGTHVQRTGDIGVFKLRGESGVAAGTRRIEAVTGIGALESIRAREQSLREIGALLHGSEEDLPQRIERLLAQQRQMEKQLAQLQRRLAGNQSGDLLSQVKEVRGKKVIASEVEATDPKRLLELADQLRQRLGSGIVILATRQDGQVRLLAAVTEDLTSEVHAGKLISQLAPILGGKGPVENPRRAGARPRAGTLSGGDAPSRVRRHPRSPVRRSPPLSRAARSSRRARQDG